ncbi:MAG: TVP38/TMEM64 family protein, partial [Halobacteriales archaeon]
MDVGRRELAGLAVVAAVVAAGLLTSPTATLRTLAALGDRPLAFAMLLVGVWIVRPFLGWPTVAVSAGVGYVLGPVWGLPVAMVGVVATSAPPFYAASRFADAGVLAALGDHGRAYFRA